MVKYKLRPLSELAKGFSGPGVLEGALGLRPNGTKLGRSVPKHEGYRFPADWGQLSGLHCRLFAKEVEVRLPSRTPRRQSGLLTYDLHYLAT